MSQLPVKSVQYFTDEYLLQCKSATPKQVLEFLENYRLMHVSENKSKLISLKIPETFLTVFRNKCEMEGVKYQTQIKTLMKQWVSGYN